MKKIMFMMALALVMFAMQSCGDDSPKAVTETALNALQNQNVETLVTLQGDKDGNALSAEEQEQRVKMLTGLFNLAGDKIDKLKIKSYTILSEEVDGDKAVVTYETENVSGTKITEKMTLKKGEDGKWRIIS